MLRTLSVVAMSILLMPVICLYRKLPRSICILRSLSNSAHSTNAPAMSSIESIVAAFLHNDCRIAANSYVLLSVSGGLDSMAMLHILTAISRKYLPLDLEVISFNHKLREESDEELSFVSSWADHYNLRFYERNLPENLRKVVGLQATAREWRRTECFKIISDQRKKLADSREVVANSPDFQNPLRDGSNSVDIRREERIAVFATAHHADDQQETILLKFLRGAHISNLQPMLPRSDCHRIIHPLLSVSKLQLEDYMRLGKFEWREDSSNLLRKYKRNVVRLDLLPVMTQLAGGAAPLRRRFDALGDQSAELQQWLNVEADKFFAHNLPGFPLLDQIATKINDDSTSPFFVSTKDKVSEILIKINVDSPFLQLASPLIQREILQRIYKYLSNGKTLSYETTCKLLSFTTQDIDISKKKKIMQLDKEILAIHLGNYLVFDVDGMTTSQIGTEIVDAETDDGSNLNETESEGIAKNGQCISYKSVTVTLDEGLTVAVKEIEREENVQQRNSTFAETRTKQSGGLLSNCNSDRNVFIAMPKGFLGNGSETGLSSPSSSLSSISLYNLPFNSNIHIRFPIDGDRFQPDWRKNEALSTFFNLIDYLLDWFQNHPNPTRVVEFLRGQKVPLHLRNRVPIVLLKHLDSSKENLSDITLDSPLISNTFQIANEVLEEVISIPPFVIKKYMGGESRDITEIECHEKRISLQIDFLF